MKSTKTERISFRVTKDFVKEVSRVAKEDHRSISDWIYLTIETAIAARQSQKERVA